MFNAMTQHKFISNANFMAKHYEVFVVLEET